MGGGGGGGGQVGLFGRRGAVSFFINFPRGEKDIQSKGKTDGLRGREICEMRMVGDQENPPPTPVLTLQNKRERLIGASGRKSTH